MRLKNRLVMAPMVRNYATENGLVTDSYIAHIGRVAQGGVGMIVLEASFIDPQGKGFVRELGIHDAGVIPGLRRLAHAAHNRCAKICIQLYHAGRQTSSKITGAQPVAPSAIPDPTINEVPRELSEKEIVRLARAYGEAAGRAKKAGFDFAEIHGAHGYLITQFLSPFSNRRKDEFGGSAAKRLRFALEVVEQVRKAVGKNFPVTMRLSGDELVSHGITIKDTQTIARALQKAGVDALHISAGNYASYAQGLLIPPMVIRDGPLQHLAAGVKKVVKIPVVAVAKIRTPELAEKILRQKKADFIALGRELLADPDWPKKAKAGRADLISRCIACNQGCISRLFAQKDVWCTVNPECGREALFAQKPKRKKRILVIGAGPAGLAAVRVAAARGHEVTLFEKSDRLGGQLVPASIAPHRNGWQEFREDLIRDIKRLKIKVFLNREFESALHAGKKYDLAIMATGSIQSRPNIKGVQREHVVSSRDALEKPSLVKGRVAILGGGCAGAQTAEFLAGRKHQVTVVELLPEVATDAPVDERHLLLERLQKMGVKILTKTKALAIGSKSVSLETSSGKRTLAADTVVLCLGSIPADGLEAELKEVARKVVLVGDAHSVGQVTAAVSEAALAALDA